MLIRHFSLILREAGMYNHDHYTDEEATDEELVKFARTLDNEAYEHRGKGWDFSANRSVNAVNAEKKGKFIIADWEKKNKVEILQRIMDKISSLGGPLCVNFDINLLKKAQKSALLKLFLDNYGEYHHVKVKKERGFFREEVYYYEISIDKLKNVANTDIESAIFSVAFDNQVKKSKRLEQQARKQAEDRLAAEKPLIIGIFSKRDYYFNKWQSSFTTFIGIIDGSLLYYYDLPRKKGEQLPYTNEQLKDFKIRKTTWPYYESPKYKNVHTYKTFAAFIKKYPEYAYKRNEILQLKALRKKERAKLK